METQSRTKIREYFKDKHFFGTFFCKFLIKSVYQFFDLVYLY